MRYEEFRKKVDGKFRDVEKFINGLKTTYEEEEIKSDMSQAKDEAISNFYYEFENLKEILGEFFED